MGQSETKERATHTTGEWAELLGAAKDAADMLRTAIEVGTQGITDFDPESHHGLKRLRAAIAKAEGRS